MELELWLGGYLIPSLNSTYGKMWANKYAIIGEKRKAERALLSALLATQSSSSMSSTTSKELPSSLLISSAIQNLSAKIERRKSRSKLRKSKLAVVLKKGPMSKSFIQLNPHLARARELAESPFL